MPLICPHCKKEVIPPYFRFCNHCNGNIKSLIDEFKKSEEETHIPAPKSIPTPKTPVLIDVSVSDITDSSSFGAAFTKALQSSPVISAMIAAFSNNKFEEMRHILKEAVDAINQLKKFDAKTPQFLNVDSTISGEESSVIKLLKNAKKYDVSEDDMKTALDAFFSTLVINYLNLTITAIEKMKIVTEVRENLQLAESIVKSTDNFLLIGFVESLFSCFYLTMGNVLRSEDYQKVAMEAFKRIKNEELLSAARNSLSDARHFALWKKLFNAYFIKK